MPVRFAGGVPRRPPSGCRKVGAGPPAKPPRVWRRRERSSSKEPSWGDYGFCETTISTRRLLARPSADPLSAIDREGPKPCDVTRSAAMPRDTR
jgi:hypothetical protein